MGDGAMVRWQDVSEGGNGTGWWVNGWWVSGIPKRAARVSREQWGDGRMELALDACNVEVWEGAREALSGRR